MSALCICLVQRPDRWKEKNYFNWGGKFSKHMVAQFMASVCSCGNFVDMEADARRKVQLPWGWEHCCSLSLWGQVLGNFWRKRHISGGKASISLSIYNWINLILGRRRRYDWTLQLFCRCTLVCYFEVILVWRWYLFSNSSHHTLLLSTEQKQHFVRNP